MFLNLILLVIGFMVLIKSADYLIEGASALAIRASISEIVIGLTIVSFGTSAPELVVNILSSIQGQTGISFGNVIGSNIVNILLILGVAGVILPIQTMKNTVWREIPFSLMAVIALFVLCNDVFFSGAPFGELNRGDGIILLLFFIIFVTYTFGIAKVESQHKPDVKYLSIFKIILFIAAGLIGLFLGGKLIVDNAIDIARNFAISEKFIGLTIISIGTSLPELFTSAIAAYKRKSDIAIGNIVGSNIFNIFFILGISALIRPLPFHTNLNSDFLVLIVASFLLFFTMFTGKKRLLDRWEAILFLIIYVGYTVFLIWNI